MRKHNNNHGVEMNNDQIQQANLVSDDAVAAMDNQATATAEPEIIKPQSPTVSEPAADPVATAAPSIDPVGTTTEPAAEPAVEASATPGVEPVTPTEPTAATPAPDTPQPSDLDAIKKDALDQLQPLIEHVEQSPEERFETIMMMIRANDDSSLIASAYEATQGIQDEKTKANALLNIVSEIEYLKSKQSK